MPVYMKKNLHGWCIGLILVILLTGCTSSGKPTGSPDRVNPDISSFLIEEHEICSASVDTPDHFEFKQRIPDDVLALREKWREPGEEARLKSPNTVLQSFGFSLRPHPEDPVYSWQVMQGDAVLVDNVTFFWTPTVREDGADFAFPVENDHGKRLLVSTSGVEPLGETYAFTTMPVYAGDDLLHAEFRDEQVVVMRGDEAVFSTRVKEDTAVSSPLKSFWSWQGGWVLEVPYEVFIVGENINQQLGFGQIFNWRLLDGEPFFFFVDHQRDGMVGMAYAGQVMNERYDEVIHYRCCEPGAFNVNSNEHMVWFYALRDGIWYYVEAGLFADTDI